MSAAGLETTGHPLLGAAVQLADSNTHVFSGRISLATHPWLADHAVMDTVLLPGTAFVELALHAGTQTGYPHLEELTLHTPLTLPDEAHVQLQLTVNPPDSDERRTLTLHSRLHIPITTHRTSYPGFCHAAGTLDHRQPRHPVPRTTSTNLAPHRRRTPSTDPISTGA